MARKNELPKLRGVKVNPDDFKLPREKAQQLERVCDWHQQSAHSYHMIGPPNIGREQDYFPSPVSKPAKYKGE